MVLASLALTAASMDAAPATAKRYVEKIGGLQTTAFPGEGKACHVYGYFRFRAVKGVDSYEIRFNDRGAERSVVVAKPFPEDDVKTPYGTIRAGKGMHQDIYTAVHSSLGNCDVDFASRATNVRLIYHRAGTHIDGTVTKACDAGRCGVKGVKVTARNPKGGAKSATTNAAGYYSIEVKPGRYVVKPRRAKLTFAPKHRNVAAKRGTTVKADFKVREKGKRASLTVRVEPKDPELTLREGENGDLEPASTSVTVTVTNSGRETAESVTLDNLRITWDDPRAKAPKPLPLAQTAGPAPGSLGDLEPGQSASATYAIEARGDGRFTVAAQAAAEDPIGPVAGRGSAAVKSTSPVLFMYARVDRRVESPQARGLFVAGTAFTIRVRLQNRSYTKTVAVHPFAPGLAGNAYDGSIQPAGKPFQVGPAIEKPAAVKPARFYVLKPREERLLDVIVRTNSGVDPSLGPAGSRAIVTFEKPTASEYRPKTGRLIKLDDELVGIASDARTHQISLLLGEPAPSPFSALRAAYNFTSGAAVGVAYSLAGMVRAVFWDLPLFAIYGSSALAQTVTERVAELWRAAERERGARARFRAVMQEGKRQLLQDFERLGRVPSQLDRAAVNAFTGAERRVSRVARQWYEGDWQSAATDIGLATGRTAGDLVLADLAFARAVAILPRLKPVQKAVEAGKATRARAARAAVEALTRVAQPAQRVMRFLNGGRIKPGFIFKARELIHLYGLTRRQSRFLAALAKRHQVLITVRSRGAGAIKWLKKKAAYVKPEWVKIKNVNRIDVEYLGFHPSHLDSVVVNTRLPARDEVIQRLNRAGVTDPVERQAVLQRLDDRTFELTTDAPGYYRQISGYASTNRNVSSRFNWKDNHLDPKGRGGQRTTARFKLREEGAPGNQVVRVSVEGGGFKRLTGDNDLVSITKADGTPLSNDELVEILDQLRGPPICIQHPATDTWVRGGAADFAEKRKQLGSGNPVQFAPDGRARMVRFNGKRSWFSSALRYTLHWDGGYRHIGNYGSPVNTRPQRPFRAPVPCFAG